MSASVGFGSNSTGTIACVSHPARICIGALERTPTSGVRTVATALISWPPCGAVYGIGIVFDSPGLNAPTARQLLPAGMSDVQTVTLVTAVPAPLTTWML